MTIATHPAPAPVSCSFCGRWSSAVFHMVAGPNAYMCDDCIDLAAATLAEKRRGVVAQLDEIRRLGT